MPENNYSIRIIEEAQVPLSAGGADYRGIATVIVLACIIATVIIMYLVWFNGHRKRIAELSVMGIDSGIDTSGLESISLFHPIRAMRLENELENQVVAATAGGRSI